MIHHDHQAKNIQRHPWILCARAQIQIPDLSASDCREFQSTRAAVFTEGAVEFDNQPEQKTAAASMPEVVEFDQGVFRAKDFVLVWVFFLQMSKDSKF